MYDLLDEYRKRIEERASNLLGYPESMYFDYKPLMEFMNYNIDNLGDPFSDLIYGVNSTSFEREVLDYFARLYDTDLEESWGYVTSCGSEGNLYGLYLGREALPTGVLYYSADTHYSVAKAARILGFEKRVVPTLDSGEIDYDALEHSIRENIERPVVVNVNVGTTVTGAIDDVDRILEILDRNEVTDFYLHCDAALAGMMLPFMADPAHRITFDRPIGSVSVSGHKFIGAPYPCGIVVARREHVRRIETTVEYTGALDATIGGSRNGQAPIFLWHAITTRGAENGFAREVQRCMDTADYLCTRLAALEYPFTRNAYSNTVVFKEPSTALVRKWSLARQAGLAHIITMPHVTRERVDAFVADLTEEVARQA